MYSNKFHFTPYKNWLNDPNGLVYYQGEYHLFYQHNPNDSVWGPMHWGHAVSKDLINWTHLPIALSPDELGTIFSGSIVIDWNDKSKLFNGKEGLVAIFTHHSDNEETQSIAYSLDNGRSFIKYEKNPIIKSNGAKDFRDPKVFWHYSTKKWVAVLACGDRIKFYSSTNLIDWDYESEFSKFGINIQSALECPDLFELCVGGNEHDKRWVLKVDIGNGAIAGGSGGIYLIGTFNGKCFTTENIAPNPKWIDYCKDFYASQSWHNTQEEQNRVLWIAWMNNWQYANKIPASGFNGIMSMPREIELTRINGEIFLAQKPFREIINLREKINSKIQTFNNGKSRYTFEKNTNSIEMKFEINLNSETEIDIKFNFAENEFLTLRVEGNNNKIILDRTQAGNTTFSEYFGGKFEASIREIIELLTLHIFIDRNTFELFVNEGIINFTSLILTSESVKSLEINSFGENNDLRIIDMYKLG